MLRLQQPNLVRRISNQPQSIETQIGRKKTIKLTILSSLHAGSLGCAPTPNQYFARDVSSLMSLIALPSPDGGGLGMGSYVPAPR